MRRWFDVVNVFRVPAHQTGCYTKRMDTPYGNLLDASIRALEARKARGDRHISVDPGTWTTLSGKPQPRPAAVKPATAPAAQGAASTLTAVPLSAAATPDRTQTPSASAMAASKSPATPVTKAAQFQALRTRVLACTLCPHLVKSRTQVVFGVGNIDSPLMFVGEAPGADEDLQGEPFVGKAGQLLTKIIETMGLQRSSIYIANILKCRPDTPGQTSGNRKPTTEEMNTCIPHLREQIDLIQPKVLVALGATAVEGLLGGPVYITKMRGKWSTYHGIPLMPTYHPSYVLRNQSLATKREVWEDMLQVMERLEMPVSSKQRAFFLPPAK